ncbi:hypothetical protein ES705_27997 [subsurface metagenome]
MANNRKPRHIKEAQGTLRKSRETGGGMIWDRLESIPDPEYCEGMEATYYYQVTSALLEAGVLAKAFLPGIERAAFWYGLFTDARDHIRKHSYTQQTKSGYSQITAYVTVMQTAYKFVCDFESRFGLNLADSIKLDIQRPGQDPLLNDPMFD